MNIRIALKLFRTLEQLRKHERWTRPQLEEYQARALLKLRNYAYKRSPFYQRFHKGLMERPLTELPVLTKALLMRNFDDLVTDRSLRLENVRRFAGQGEAAQRFQDRYYVTATSGSSGLPGFFLFDESEWAFVLASFARGQDWSGGRIGLSRQQKMATVASISPWHMSSQVTATVQSWWRPSIRIPASQPISKTVEQLNKWQPEILIAYASMAGVLAEEQLSQRLHIRPKAVYVASEVLTSQTKQQVKEAWGEEPYNQYAATETAGIASVRTSCRHMHFYEDLVIMEVVDDHYRPVPAGEDGEKLLVTTLFSRTQPLIRYELNDSVCVSAGPHPCRLPFRVLERMQGRVEDSLMLPALSGGEVLIRPLVINRIMDIAPISRWQIQQQADGGLVILLSGTRDGLTDHSLAEKINKSLSQEGALVPYVRIQHVSEIPKTATGKTPLIKAYKPS